MRKSAVARGVWGHAPQELFRILDVLRSILLLFGTLFYHGKASVIAVVQLQRINSCRVIGFADAHADWATVYGG